MLPDIPRPALSRRSPAFQVAGALLVALALLAALYPSSAKAQKPRKALTKGEVLELLNGAVPSARVAEIARERGIAFVMTRATENQIREAGGSPDLLKVLRELAPRPPAAPTSAPKPSAPAPSAGPPALLIEATPGDAQVYVDDEPVGTTSSEGRLKLPHLSPGEHKVRVSLAGYRSYEQSVELTTSQTATVRASLQPAKAAVVPRPEIAQVSTQTGATTSDATLGVLLAETPPAGTQGVYISDVVPAGPADKAGLRPGYSILSIEGRAVSTPEQVQQLLAALHPGVVADITYWNGSTAQTTGAKLVPRSSTSPASSSVGLSSPQSLGQASGATSESTGTISFPVVHDHGPPAPNYCAGIMTIGNGMVAYRSLNGFHSFEIPVSTIKEAKKNAVYLAAYGAFHIRLKKGTVYNFAVITPTGQYQPPDALLDALDRAMGKQ
jgi:hypothetical protein